MNPLFKIKYYNCSNKLSLHYYPLLFLPDENLFCLFQRTGSSSATAIIFKSEEVVKRSKKIRINIGVVYYIASFAFITKCLVKLISLLSFLMYGEFSI